MSGGDLTVVVPLWRRTTNIERVFASVRATVPAAELLFVVSETDRACLQRVTTREHRGYPRATGDWRDDREVMGAHNINASLVVPGDGGTTGDYAKKINAGYRTTERPFIFTGADDIVFRPGWYEAARALISTGPERTVVNETAPAGALARGIGVVGTVDDCNPRTSEGTHSTHSLVARWYADGGVCIDQAGVIYHEGYEHDYCDDELIQTAMTRGVYAHAFGAHVTHLHPWQGGAPDDETYQRGRSRTRLSRSHYRRREQLWNPGGVRRV